MERMKILVSQVSALKGCEDVIAVMLFGSFARGEEQPLSDIDICIIPQEGVPIERLLELSAHIDADVSFFYHLPLHIRYGIFAEGKELLVNDEKKYNWIKSRTIHEYLDIKPMRERLLRNMMESGVF